MKYRFLIYACCLGLLAQAQEPTPEPAPTSPVETAPAPQSTAEKKPAVETLLTLQMAQEMAIKDSPTIDAAEARITQAIERVKQARAAWFPTVFAEASASNTWISESDYDFAKRAASDGYWTSFALGTQARLQGENVIVIGHIE